MTDVPERSGLPDPLVPADLDLRQLPSMLLDVRRLRDSEIAHSTSGEAFRAAVLLWCVAWHQVPASSLPNDDAALSRYAGFGRDLRGWRRVKDAALHGFVECSDGRIYHRVIAEKALEAAGHQRNNKGRTSAANAAHWGTRQPDSGTGSAQEKRSQRLAAARARGRHSPEEWGALRAFGGHHCVRCGASERLVKDHIIPIYQNGSDAIDNIQPMCVACNSSKGADRTDYRKSGWKDAVSNASSLGVQNASTEGVPQGVPQGVQMPSVTPSDEALNASWTPPTESKVRERNIREQERSKKDPTGLNLIGSGARETEAARVLSAEDEAWMQFRTDVIRQYENSGKPPPDSGYVQVWRHHGYALAVCRAIVLSRQGKMPRNLKYFDDQIVEALTKPVLAQPRQAPQNTQAADPETIDWDRAVATFASIKVWPDDIAKISSEPGSKTCRAPQETLAKYGFSRKELPRSGEFTYPEWDQMITSFHSDDEWNRTAGPSPDEPGCRAPIVLLHRHGYRRMISESGKGVFPDPNDPLPTPEGTAVEPGGHAGSINGSGGQHPTPESPATSPAPANSIQEKTT